MRRWIPGAVLGLLLPALAGCAGSGDAGRKAADEQAEQENAEREQARREHEQVLAAARLREELKNDFELLLGHWEQVAGRGAGGPRAANRLEIDTNSVAHFRLVAGSVESPNACKFRLSGEGGRRYLVQDDPDSRLKLTRLAYRVEGDRLTLEGSASDLLVNDVALSGEWRRVDWTRRSEAEIADVLKQVHAELVYDESSPTKPIVKVSFAFQAPAHNVHLRPLAGLRHLREVDLTEATLLTDAGLQHLAPLKQLKLVNLSNLQLSREAVEQLKAALPDCRVVH
jgi:hypothetical protein